MIPAECSNSSLREDRKKIFFLAIAAAAKAVVLLFKILKTYIREDS